MKPFLRHIFLLLAMLVATASLTAQTYNGGTWYSLYETGERTLNTIDSETLNAFTPVGTNLTFDAKKQTLGANSLRIAPIVNGSQQSNIFENGLSTSYKSYSATVSNPNSNQIKFYTVTGATLKKYFKNVKLPLKKHILLNDNTSNGQKWGVSSITLTDNSLATAEGKTSTSAYTIRFRSFLASGNITITSSNPEFHFGNGQTSITLGVANNYCASTNGSGNCSATTLGQISNYSKQIYFSPAVQHNKNTRSTTITISDGTSTAYIYLSAPIIPTYFFKAEAIASPAEGGTTTATFSNGQDNCSVIATNYATTSMSATVTFTVAPNSANGYVFEGWKTAPTNTTFYKQGADKTTFTETITSSALNPNGLASQLTYYAIYSRRYTAKITGSNYANKLVNDSWKADYQFVNTQTAIPTNSEADPFYFKIEHNFTGNDTREGSPRPDEVIAYDPTTNTITALNEGTATITFYQKNTSSHEPVTESFTVQVIKHTPKFTWNAARTPYYYGTSIPNIFSTTNSDIETTFVSDNEAFARVENNTLYIANARETATITVLQPENYKWYGNTEQYPITPVNADNHVPFTINSENYYNVFRYDNTGNLSWKNDGVLLGSPDVWSESGNKDDRYYDIVFTGVPDKLSFTYERSTDIATGCDWYVKESVDGVTWSEKNVWEIGKSNSGSVEVQLNPTTRYLRFCYSGNYGGYFRNIKVTELEKFEAGPKPLDFGTQSVNFGQQKKQVAFEHANAGRETTVVIEGADADYFSVSPTTISNTGRDLYGTTYLNVTFDNGITVRGDQPYTATLVIKDNAGHREEVALTGVRNGKATPVFTWNPNSFPYYFNTSIANIVVSSNTDYANCPLTITSSNESIAKVENGRLYIYNQSGEVTFTVTQQGNDSYDEHTETFTFTPKAKPDLEVPFQVTQTIYNQAITVGDNCSWDGDDHHLKLGNGAWDDTRKTAILVFSGRPDKLTFTYATSYNLAVIEIGSFDNPSWEVEESSDGENWQSIWSVRTNSTNWENVEIQLSETTQYVRFSYDGNYAGYFKNINISELVGYKYLRAADGHYLSRGAKWGTQAVVDAFGVVSRLSRYTLDNENIYTRFFFLDNEQYMFETETEDEQRLHEVFTDNGTAANTNHLWKIDDNGGVLTIQSANEVGEVSHKGSYITVINGVLAFTTNEAEATKWQMEDYTEHPQYIADMLNRQAAEAAFKDFGKDINTLEKVRNRLTVEDFEAHEIIIPILELGEQKGEGRTVEGMPHIYEQTITGLDPGFYRLTIKAFYRISNSEIAWKCNQEKGKESVLAYAYANNVQSPIQSVYASSQSSAIENTDELHNGNYYSTTLSSAAIAFNDVNRYLNDVYVYVEADPGQTTGTLHYGIKSPSYVPGAWLAYGTVTLTHFGRKEYIFKGSDPEKPTDWHTAENWNRGAVPNQYHNVRISENTSISTPVSVYSLTIDKSICVHVASKGGINVGNGGVTADATDVQNIIIDNDLSGAGFLCINPTATHRSPKVQVNYTTRAKSGDANEQVWQYVGAPGENPVMSSTENAKIYYWSETEGWVKHSANFEPFKGYAISQKNNANDTYAITVTPIIASHTVELTKTSDGMNGDNLFVNSYLAPIDLTTFTDFDDALNDPNDDFKGDFEKTFYLFNSGSLKDCYDNGGKGSEQLANGSSPGQYYAITPLGAALLDQDLEQTTIPPMQGVYVVANENGAKIHLDYNKHVYKAQTNNLNRPMRVQQEENENFIRVRLQVNSPNSGADRMYVIQHENTTRNYDNGYDARNILAESQVNIYTNEADGQMEISVADQIDSTFIGFTAGEDSVYTLTFTSLVGKDMYLHDFVADSLFLLVEDGQYSFSAQPNSVNDLRFQLILYPELSDNLEDNVTTGMEDVLSSARIWVSDKQIYITNALQNSTLDIYTVSGMCITSSLTIHDAPCTIDLSHLPTGVYVLRLNNQAYKFVCK